MISILKIQMKSWLSNVYRGHIGIFVSKKAVDTILPAIADWFRERD